MKVPILKCTEQAKDQFQKTNKADRHYLVLPEMKISPQDINHRTFNKKRRKKTYQTMNNTGNNYQDNYNHNQQLCWHRSIKIQALTNPKVILNLKALLKLFKPSQICSKTK